MKSALIKLAFMFLLILIFVPPEASAARVCVIPIAPADYTGRYPQEYYPRHRSGHRRCYYPRYRYGYYRSVPPYGYYVRPWRYRR